MTDNDIIKALEHCVIMAWIDECEGCPLRENSKCITVAKRNALNLINRQKAEIDSLRKSAEIAKQNAVNTSRAMQNIAKATRAEAYKVFAEKTDKIITEIYNKFIFGDYDLGDEAREAIMDFCVDISHDIDNLVKEMTEEQE